MSDTQKLQHLPTNPGVESVGQPQTTSAALVSPAGKRTILEHGEETGENSETFKNAPVVAKVAHKPGKVR
jgi:hypothetical protein